MRTQKSISVKGDEGDQDTCLASLLHISPKEVAERYEFICGVNVTEEHLQTIKDERFDVFEGMSTDMDVSKNDVLLIYKSKINSEYVVVFSPFDLYADDCLLTEYFDLNNTFRKQDKSYRLVSLIVMAFVLGVSYIQSFVYLGSIEAAQELNKEHGTISILLKRVLVIELFLLLVYVPWYFFLKRLKKMGYATQSPLVKLGVLILVSVGIVIYRGAQ